MKKNVLLMMCLLFFLTGCSAEYNIVIKKDSISEELQVYDENSYYESEIEKKIEEDINIKTGVLINEQNGDTEDTNPNYTYYLKEKINSKGKLGIKYTNTFNVDDYSKSYIANNCYKYFQVYKDKKYMTISTSKEFLCIENFDKLYEVKINIKTKYNVEKNNADEVSNNVYSWTITKNNFDDKSLYIKIDMTKMAEKSEEQKKQDEKVLKIFKTIGIILLILVVIVGLVLFNKKRKLENN